MTSLELITQLRRAGIELTANGDKLHIEFPEGALTPELQEEIRTHKAELLALLRYKDPAARLYPHIGKLVWCPDGEGRLWQVFATRVGVALGGRIGFYSPEDIEPSREGGRTS